MSYLFLSTLRMSYTIIETISKYLLNNAMQFKK